MAGEKKPNILFDTLNALFTNKEYINDLTKETIKQNIFMINRRIAIKFPLQAQVFNNSKTNAVDVLKFWSDFLYTGQRPPGWPGCRSPGRRDGPAPWSGAGRPSPCRRPGYSDSWIPAPGRPPSHAHGRRRSGADRVCRKISRLRPDTGGTGGSGPAPWKRNRLDLSCPSA